MARLTGATDRGNGPWVLQLICCGHDDGTERFQTWDQADAFRNDYTSPGTGHERSGILSLASA